MPPYVCVILPILKTSDAFARLILPVDALKAVDSAKWHWDPTIGDGVVENTNNTNNTNTNTNTTTLLKLAQLHNRPTVDILNNTWDFCANS